MEKAGLIEKTREAGVYTITLLKFEIPHLSIETICPRRAREE
jgi:hypothetical protein